MGHWLSDWRENHITKMKTCRSVTIRHKSHMYWLGIEIGFHVEGPATKPQYNGRDRHFKKEAKSRAAVEYSSVAGAQRLKIVIIAKNFVYYTYSQTQLYFTY